jgi:hypothetical protein
VEHATAITSVVPDAVVFGPVNYGYAGFMNLQAAPDAWGATSSTSTWTR